MTWKSSKINFMWLDSVLTFSFVCFVEEVILADDENENDYDGMDCSFLCSCAYMNVIFKKHILMHVIHSSITALLYRRLKTFFFYYRLP